ncbi:MAG: hypothetical protein HC812_01715 [Leptolyngbya sp. RL_3_1]|nr:hypothetical protein [Leptolyngbya sp. RL_3_1]
MADPLWRVSSGEVSGSELLDMAVYGLPHSMFKSPKIRLWTLCMILGGGTLSTVAQLDLPVMFKGYALIIPLQIAALIYVAVWYRRDRKSVLR